MRFAWFSKAGRRNFFGACVWKRHSFYTLFALRSGSIYWGHFSCFFSVVQGFMKPGNNREYYLWKSHWKKYHRKAMEWIYFINSFFPTWFYLYSKIFHQSKIAICEYTKFIFKILIQEMTGKVVETRWSKCVKLDTFCE